MKIQAILADLMTEPATTMMSEAEGAAVEVMNGGEMRMMMNGNVESIDGVVQRIRRLQNALMVEVTTAMKMADGVRSMEITSDRLHLARRVDSLHGGRRRICTPLGMGPGAV